MGKTTMLNVYVHNKFLFDTKMTIGSDIFHKMFTLKNGLVCSLQIWDFGGQERFRFLLDSFVKGAMSAFLMFAFIYGSGEVGGYLVIWLPLIVLVTIGVVDQISLKVNDTICDSPLASNRHA